MTSNQRNKLFFDVSTSNVSNLVHLNTGQKGSLLEMCSQVCSHSGPLHFRRTLNLILEVHYVYDSRHEMGRRIYGLNRECH